jgi:hypothetical protein
VDDSYSKSFGYLIGFVIPGFLGLWAASFVVEDVRTWLVQAATQETTVGSAVLVLLASLGVGIFVNGVRNFVLEDGLFRFAWARVPDRVEDALEEKRRDPHVQAAYSDLRERFLFFSYFYGNTALTLPFWLVAWLWNGSATPSISAPWIAGAFAAAESVLLLSARDCLLRFRKKKARLLGGTSTGEVKPMTNGDEHRHPKPQPAKPGPPPYKPQPEPPKPKQ